MKLQKSNHTILLVLEKGEDIVECITTFADDQDLTFTSVSGIGACDDVVL
ncbi:PCC domain-containing protein, partial [Staphylococcus aureus]